MGTEIETVREVERDKREKGRKTERAWNIQKERGGEMYIERQTNG